MLYLVLDFSNNQFIIGLKFLVFELTFKIFQTFKLNNYSELIIVESTPSICQLYLVSRYIFA